MVDPSCGACQREAVGCVPRCLSCLLHVHPLISACGTCSANVALSQLHLCPRSFLSVRFVIPPVSRRRGVTACLSIRYSHVSTVLTGAHSDVGRCGGLGRTIVARTIAGNIHNRQRVGSDNGP